MLLSSLAVQGGTVQALPFILITDLSPVSPQIWDTVLVTVRVEANRTAPARLMSWDFGDNQSFSTMQNMTGAFMVTVGHIYVKSGSYYVRVRVVDALNRTAEDVSQLLVKPRTTLLTFQVSPAHVNASRGEQFTFQAQLSTDQGTALVGEPLAFWYTGDGVKWYSASGGKTTSGGYLVMLWSPPFEGEYRFKVTYEGSQVYASSWQQWNIIAIAAPEFPNWLSGLIVPITFFSFLVLARRRCNH